MKILQSPASKIGSPVSRFCTNMDTANAVVEHGTLKCRLREIACTNLRLRNSRQWRGRARYRAAERLVERNVVVIQRLAGGPVEFHTGFSIADFGHHLVRLRLQKVALDQNDVVERRSSQLVLLLFRVERLLLQNARFPGGLVTRPGLAHSDDGVLHLHADLVLKLLQADLLLAEGQLVVDDVRPSGAVPQRNIEIEADAVVRKIAREQLGKQGGCPANEKHVAA